MTSQKDQLQAVIQEIDNVLNRPAPRLPWVNSDYTEHQRRVLEQTRHYLASLDQQSPNIAAPNAPIEASTLWAPQPTSVAPPSGYTSGESAQQVLLAVLQEMGYLRSSVMQPLRSDIEALQQKKEALAQEVRFLEAQRQQYTPLQQQANQQQVISDFLQSLMGRLQENLTGQVAQMLTNLETETAASRSLGEAPTYPTVLTPRQRLEHLQMLQAQSDQLLLKLDSTLQVIFESLQTNLQSYQDSLSQGLDKMHSMGQQGEAMFAALVNRLAQQLGREASTYLQSSLGSTERESRPLPGVEIPSAGLGAESGLLINQVSQGESLSFLQQPIPPDLMAELEGLNLLDLELERSPQPPTPFSPVEEELTLPQFDPAIPLPGFAQSEEDQTFFQLDEPITAIQPDLEELAPMPGLAEEAFDSATLLDQLTATVAPTETETDNPASSTDEEMDELYESLFGITTDEALVEPSTESSKTEQDNSPAAAVSPVVAEPVEPEPVELEPVELGPVELEPVVEPEYPIEESAPPEVAWDTAAQSLETFLFDGEPALEADLEPEESEVDSMFDWEEAIAASEEPDTIASLNDLIAPTESGSTNLPDLLHGELAEPASTDDEYIAASPEETLLVPETDGDRTEIRLPPNVLQQLAADLSNLEGLDQAEMTSDLDLSAIADEEWTLAWQEDSEAPISPTGETTEPIEQVEPSLSIEPAESTGISWVADTPPAFDQPVVEENQEDPDQTIPLEMFNSPNAEPPVQPDEPVSGDSEMLFEEFPFYAATSQETDDPFPETLFEFASPIETDAPITADAGLDPLEPDFELVEEPPVDENFLPPLGESTPDFVSEPLPDDLFPSESLAAESLSLENFAVSAHTWSDSPLMDDSDDETLENLFERPLSVESLNQPIEDEPVPNLFSDEFPTSPPLDVTTADAATADASAFSFSAAELALPLEDSSAAAPTELTLEDFNLVEPIAEPTASPANNLEFTLETEEPELTLDRFADTVSDVPANPDQSFAEPTFDRESAELETQTESPLESDELNALFLEEASYANSPTSEDTVAFTLEGLDSLFEDVPDRELEVVPIPEPGAADGEMTLEDIFASPATPEAPFSLEEDPTLPDSQKKTTHDRQP